ncbi:MAG: metallophosphoesterase [Oscillospiraceae bacterium]|jgi:hypothetical protein|nr:metallophosphoesterase [Oscillospiraceae bacterium]
MFQEEKGRKWGALLAAVALVVSLVTTPALAVPSLKPGQGETVIVAGDDGTANGQRVPRQVNVHMGDDPSTQVNFTYTTHADSTTQVVIRKRGESDAVTLQGTAGVGQDKKFFHAIAVEGLQPDTAYEYTVGFGANTYSGKFQTAPPKGSRRTVKFAYLADTQVSNAVNARSLGATLHEVNQIPNLDFVYIAGDVTDTAANESQWEQLFYNEGAYPNGGQDMFGQNLLAVTQGNHDNNVMYRHINAPAQQGNIVYAFDYGPATFIILNLESARSNATARAQQTEFLKAAVADAKARGQWTLVGFHKSLVTGASHITDTDVVEARTYWIPIFAELDVDFVLQGHDHVYSRGFVSGDGTRAYGEIYGRGTTAPDPENAPLYMIGGHAGGLKWYSRKNYIAAPGDPLIEGYAFLDIDSANPADNHDGLGSDVKREQVIVEVEISTNAIDIKTYMFKYDEDSDAITTPKYLFDSFTVTRRADELALESGAGLVKKGDYFHIDAGFSEAVPSNTAELVYTYDTGVYDYVGFTAAAGVTMLDRADTDTGVKLTVMTPGYDTTDYGRALFRARESADIKNGEGVFTLTARYVVRAEDGSKSIRSVTADTRFTTVGGTPGDVDGDDKVTLLDLSEIIDAFGVTSADSAWARCRFFDFNGNGAIDIQDIVEIARRVR